MSIHADAGLERSVFPTLSLVWLALAVAAYGCVSGSGSSGKAGDTASAGIDSATPAQTCAISVAFEETFEMVRGRAYLAETSRRWERSTGWTQEWSSDQVVLGYDGPFFQDTDWSRLERTRTVSWW